MSRIPEQAADETPPASADPMIHGDGADDRFIPESEALQWARQHLSFDHVETVRKAPWSCVYRLGNGQSRSILAAAPPLATQGPRISKLLAERFHERVPSVVASDPAQGLLLTRPVSGTRLDYDLSTSQRIAILNEYARIQSSATGDDELLASLPTQRVDTLFQQLIDYLRPDGTLPDLIGARSTADAIVGRSITRRYGPALLKRRALLKEHLQQAAALPDTINHGDLRPPNVSWSDIGECTFEHWDDAVVGSAGLSLHGLFSGCSVPVRLLAGDDLGNTFKAGEKRLPLDAYVKSLVAGGYADEELLKRSLGASITAGVMHYLLGFSRFDLSDSRYRKGIAEIFQKRLSDLLDLCDFLSLGSRETAIVHARDYIERGREPRAETILAAHLQNAPNDADAHALYAGTLHERGRLKLAETHYRHAMQINPADSRSIVRLAALRLEKLDFDAATELNRRALHIDANNTRAARQLDETFELQRAVDSARRDDIIPAVAVSAQERESGRISKARFALAEQLFLEYGVLIIENVFDLGMIEACRESLFDKYRSYFENVRHGDALRIGDKRFQVTVEIEGPFNSDELYANRFLLPLLAAWLDEKFVLGSLTASVSLPGSEEQWIHKDHPRLFSRRSEDFILPPVGVSVMVPLIDISPDVGTTKVKKKSHLVSLDKSADIPSLSPYINAGSCFLMDHRLSHKGEPNRSDRVRPILNALYHRRWFRDSLNFRNQPPIRVSEEELDKISKQHRRLLCWTGDPGPRQ